MFQIWNIASAPIHVMQIQPKCVWGTTVMGTFKSLVQHPPSSIDSLFKILYFEACFPKCHTFFRNLHTYAGHFAFSCCPLFPFTFTIGFLRSRGSSVASRMAKCWLRKETRQSQGEILCCLCKQSQVQRIKILYSALGSIRGNSPAPLIVSIGLDISGNHVREIYNFAGCLENSYPSI